MKHLSRLLFKNRGLGLLTLVFLLLLAPLSSVQAKKPIHTTPGTVILSGSVWAGDGSNCDGMDCYYWGDPVETYDVAIKSGKETSVTIVVRHFMFTAEFAKSVDFYPDKFDRLDGEEDGLTCFADSDWASGAYTLFDDYTAVFQTFPEFLTADGDAIQKYEFYLSGTHDFDLATEDFPAEGPITVVMEFDRVEITTEGKGQNRRRSCTDVFDLDPDGFFATGTFTR